MYRALFPPLLTYGPSTKTSKPMWQIKILIDSAKNGTDGHQMDQIMEKPSAAPKKKRFVFFNVLLCSDDVDCKKYSADGSYLFIYTHVLANMRNHRSMYFSSGVCAKEL